MANFLSTNTLSNGQLLWLICSVLAENESLDERRIRKLVDPNFSEQEAKPNAGAIGDSLKIGTAYRVIEKSGRNYQFAAGIEHVGDVASFRRFLRPKLLDPSGDNVSRNKPSDLMSGVAWILTANSRQPLTTDFARVEERFGHHGLKAQVFKNKERWRPFYRWAHFLGLVSIDDHSVVPDARVAISDEIAHLPKNKKMSGKSFVKSLSPQLPFLETDWIREVLDASKVRPETQTDVDFHEVLSQGLMLMDRQGQIKLRTVADAKEPITLKDSDRLRTFHEVGVSK